MAREHARIKTAIWIDDDFLDLTPPAQHLYFLIVSQMRLTFCGVFDWRPGRIAKLATGWTVEEVEAAASELSKSLYIVIDEESEEVLVRSFIRNDGLLTSPNITKAMLRDYGGISSRELKGVVVHELKRLQVENPLLKGFEVCAVLMGKRSVNPSELPPFNPSRNPSVNPSDTGESNPSINPIDTPYSLLPTPYSLTPDSPQKLAAYPAEFEAAWDLYPKKTSKKAAATAFAKAIKEVSIDVLMQAIAAHRDDPNREAKFTKHFSTWLNQGCWEDEPLPAKSATSSQQRMAQGFQMAQQLKQRPAPSNEFPEYEPDEYQMELER